MIVVETKEHAVVYSITTDKGLVIVECGDDHTLKVKGPKDLIHKAIGGRGDEDEKNAWFEDKDFGSASEAVSNVLEILKVMTQTENSFFVTSKEKTKV